MRPMFRPDPALPVGGMKTYELSAPPSTHYRPATCAEAGCANWVNGFEVLCDESSADGELRAAWLRGRSHGRKGMTEHRGEGVTRFRFPPGTECFAPVSRERAERHLRHVVPLEREPIYVVRDGDFRGNPTGHRMRHANGDDWVDDFGEHQDRIKTQLERG